LQSFAHHFFPSVVSVLFMSEGSLMPAPTSVTFKPFRLPGPDKPAGWIDADELPDS
jgi:hypothetical protein